MATQLRSDFGLPTLQILLDPQRADLTEAVFQVVRGQGSPTEVARCHVGELGLPNTLKGFNPVADRDLTVPAGVVAALQQVMPELGASPLPPHNALWLEFPSPRGVLYILPWERLLEPLGRPLFRLPYHFVRPQAPGRTLAVAICASTTAAKSPFSPPGIIDTLVDQYLNKTGRSVTVHVFTDQSWFEQVRDRFSAAAPHVIVHDPAQGADNESSGGSSRITNPWLMWMRDSMGEKPFDWVHFVTHGYLSGDRGAIAVAASPTVNQDTRWSTFLGSVELAAFLSQVGAWGFAVTGPRPNFSDAGLRELADSIASSRPGATVAHRIDRDADCMQFGAVLQTLFAPGTPLERPLPAVTCWAHPLFVEHPDVQVQYPSGQHEDLNIDVDGSSAFVTGATKAALAEADTPSWVAAATRVLETEQMRWLPGPAGSTGDEAAVEALRSVADLVERHVEAFQNERGEGGYR